MINKLTIELALKHNKTIESKYTILSFEYPITEELLSKYSTKKDSPSSFLYNLSSTDNKIKSMLRIVENYLLQEVKLIQDKPKEYLVSLSYVYFEFTNELESTIFSSPHITSPILFDPNEKFGSYRLSHSESLRSTKEERVSNISKHVDLAIAQHDNYLFGNLEPTKILKEQEIVNSLFDYRIKTDSLRSTCTKSIYSDNTNLGIHKNSQFTTKYFYTLTENKNN